jgi:hypothetical protein
MVFCYDPKTCRKQLDCIRRFKSLGDPESPAPSAPSSSSGIAGPSAPAAPTVTLEINQDVVSWVEPANNGSPIILYSWQSTDGKSGTTITNSVTVTQEGSTSQAYRVRAENAVGLSPWSQYSDEVTTTPPPFFPPYFPYFPYFCPEEGTLLSSYPCCPYTSAGGVQRTRTCYEFANGYCGIDFPIICT